MANQTGPAGDRTTAQSQRRSERRSGADRRSQTEVSTSNQWTGERDRRGAERRAFDRRNDYRPLLLAGFNASDLGLLLDHFELKRYGKGDTVVRADTQDNSLYLIRSGRFEVLVPAGGEYQSAGYLRQGDVFGELSFFDGEPRSADIRAVDRAEVLVLDPASFTKLRQSEPQLAVDLVLRIASVSSRRFRAHNRKLAALGMIAPPPIW